MSLRKARTATESKQSKPLTLAEMPSLAERTESDFTDFVKIGQGAFGTVYAATDRASGQRFALKQLELLDKGRLRGSAIIETAFLTRVRHPHIVHCDGILVDLRTGKLTLVMELAEQGTLQDHLDRGTGTWVDRLTFVAETLSALEFLHQSHIIHADLKPDNILIMGNGSSKLTDFSNLEFTRLPDADWRVGVKAFETPESLAHKKTHTAAMDIWAMGMILLQCMSRSGKLPRLTAPDESTQLEEYHKFLDHQLSELVHSKDFLVSAETKPKEHAQILAILHDCLQFDPRKRPSAGTLLRKYWLLERMLEDRTPVTTKNAYWILDSNCVGRSGGGSVAYFDQLWRALLERDGGDRRRMTALVHDEAQSIYLRYLNAAASSSSSAVQVLPINTPWAAMQLAHLFVYSYPHDLLSTMQGLDATMLTICLELKFNLGQLCMK